MGVTIKSLNEVEAECKRFLGRVEVARAVLRGEMKAYNERWADLDAKAGRKHTPCTEEHFTRGNAATGAAKRASLDLSRVLAEFRR